MNYQICLNSNQNLQNAINTATEITMFADNNDKVVISIGVKRSNIFSSFMI